MLEKLKRTIGLDPNEKQLKGIRPLVEKVQEEQKKIQKKHKNDTTEEFIKFAHQKTIKYKKIVQAKLQKVKEKHKDVLGEGHVDQIKEFDKKVQIERQKILDEILPEAYALVRETAKRTLKAPDGQPMEPFDVQVMGGVALHWGRVIEMATGEGKTLVATLPVYLNALTGEGVHIVTVNEYLAQRDARWMAPLYDALGLSVGINLSETGYNLFGSSLNQEVTKLIEERKKLEESMKVEKKEELQNAINEINEEILKKEGTLGSIGLNIDIQKKQACAADITYGTNSEFGFDYLRDNMKHSLEDKIQRGFNYCIVDEVDSILIDEARTPLIISSPVDEKEIPIKQYNDMDPVIKELVHEQKELIDEKSEHVKELFEIYKDYAEKDRLDKTLSHLTKKIEGYSVEIYKIDFEFLSKKIKKDKAFKSLYKTFDKKLFGEISDKTSDKKISNAKKSKLKNLTKELDFILEQYKDISNSKERKKNIEKIKTKLGYSLVQIAKGDPKNDLIAFMGDTKEELTKEELKTRKLFKEIFENQMYEDTSNKNKLEDKDLFFVLSERERWITLTNKGWEKVYGKHFKMPHFATLHEEFDKLDKSKRSFKEKEDKKKNIEKEYQDGIDKVNAIDKLLKAHVFYKKDTHYTIKDGEVLIIDESTGRVMPGKRYSDGLHEAIEAKEEVEIKQSSQTLANITYQNYFRMYSKMAGMTGTAETEKDEFLKIYGMDTLVIPTNKPLDRKEYNDIVHVTEKAKFKAVLQDIIERHKKGQPILVGTSSVEKSNLLSYNLTQLGIPHRVLNASRTVDMTEKLQGKVSEAVSTESEIVKRAGERGAVTISTNMAGRGTDIILGYNPELLIQDMKKEAEKLQGKEKEYVAKFISKLLQDSGFLEENPEFNDFKNLNDYEKALEKVAYHLAKKEREEIIKLGGLHVLGTERYDSRRIDNQLRGRAGRQGDPGSSIFYLSLEDFLLRLFISEKMKNMFIKWGMEENDPIEHKFLTKGIKNAQKRIEEDHFASRKYILNLDDTNDQIRRLVYRDRDVILGEKNFKDYTFSLAQDILEKLIDEHTDEKQFPEEWNWKGLEQGLYQNFGIKIPKVDKESTILEDLKKQLNDAIVQKYETRAKEAVKPLIRNEKRKELKSRKEQYLKAVKSLDEENFTEDEKNEMVKRFNGDYRTIISKVKEKYASPEFRTKAEVYIKSQLNSYDKGVALSMLDEKWRSFLSQLELLKEGINLKGYGQKDPIIEYKKQSFAMFEDFVGDIKEEVTRRIFKEYI